MSRSAVALVLVLSNALAGCGRAPEPRSAEAPREDELLRLTAQPSGDGEVALVVENLSGRSLILSRGVVIEALEVAGQGYEGRELSDYGVRAADFFLVEGCDEPASGCVTLEPGASLRTVPWTGYYAAPQCPRETPSDYAAPSGTYRFVATACSGGLRFEGEPFHYAAPER
jgi:hypothetical protein